MFKLGLTGSIGMGKSTTAQIFAENGCAIWDADAAVHRIYAKDGLAVAPMRALIPDAILDGTVSRPHLRDAISANPELLKQIEAIVHPLLAQDRADFIATAAADILVFDIPLLFETGGNARMDAVVTVWIGPDEQQARVMDRGTMTQSQFEAIRAKQLPADEKRARADFVIVTDTLDHARAQVQSVLETIRKDIANA